MLMDSSHLSNQPLIVRVLRRVRDRTNKIREVVMMMMMMMISDNGHDSDNNNKNGDDDVDDE
jgi:hypothetical protein